MSGFDIPLPSGHFIAGRYVPGDAAIEVISPSTGQRIGAIPRADAALVNEAVEAARAARAASNWGGIAPRERLKALHAWADPDRSRGRQVGLSRGGVLLAPAGSGTGRRRAGHR